MYRLSAMLFVLVVALGATTGCTITLDTARVTEAVSEPANEPATEPEDEPAAEPAEESEAEPAEVPSTTVPGCTLPQGSNADLNSDAPISAPMDISDFTKSPVLGQWRVKEDEGTHVVISLMASQEDWPSFAKQLCIDETTPIPPAQVPITTELAHDLIDYEAMAEQIRTAHPDQGFEPVDIRAMEVNYELFFVNFNAP